MSSGWNPPELTDLRLSRFDEIVNYADSKNVTLAFENHGRDWERVGDHDEHLLPFDGTFDFKKMMRKLDEYEYAGSLMLEVFNSASEEYLKMHLNNLLKLHMTE